MLLSTCFAFINEPLLKGRKLNERPSTHADNYGNSQNAT